MKKLFSLILIFVFVIASGSISFAENTTTVITEKVPGASVDENNEAITVQDELPPGNPASAVLIGDEKIPQGLPKTGGIPAEAFYVAGALLIFTAIIVSRKKVKTNTKS